MPTSSQLLSNVTDCLLDTGLKDKSGSRQEKEAEEEISWRAHLSIPQPWLERRTGRLGEEAKDCVWVLEIFRPCLNGMECWEDLILLVAYAKIRLQLGSFCT
jgi:hypothetical protein